MNPGKLVKQLRRDMTANPKKAIALGLMLLVAGYFWAPLAWGWLAPAGKRSVKVEATKLILEDEPAQPTAKRKTNQSANFRWEKARQLLLTDPRRASATFVVAWRDPFAIPPIELPTDEQNVAASAQGDAEQAGSNPAVEIGPDQAGLKVASVAIGPRGRSAIINGETYREGDLITADAANLSKPGTALPPAVEFVVRQIDKRGVELERQGKSWRLEFDQRRLAQGDEIERSETNGQR